MMRMGQDQLHRDYGYQRGEEVGQDHGVNASRQANHHAISGTNPRFVPEKPQSGCRQVLHFGEDTPSISATEW